MSLALYRSRFWLLLWAVATSVMVATDAYLLSETTGLFSGGFGAPGRLDGLGTFAYFVGSFAIDATMIVFLWILTYPLFARFAGGPIRCTSLALIIGLAPGILYSIFSHRIHVMLGSIVESRLLGGGASGFADASRVLVAEWIPGTDILILALISVLMLAVPLIARRVELDDPTNRVLVPRFGSFVASLLVVGFLSVSWLAYGMAKDDSLRRGLVRKGMGKMLTNAVRISTDWDRDQYGWSSRPPDPDPSDGSVYPYAPEKPGNGLDENGLGGDRPVAYVRPVADIGLGSTESARPHFMLIFLESFRPELLDASIDGKPVTPFLTSMAMRGGRSDRTYVHSPWTLPSRDQLFRGDVIDDPTRTTLLDDFKQRGYVAAHFSGQDDTYGDSIVDLGLDEADTHYHARDDIALRTSRSTVPVSLQISWKTLGRRVHSFLDEFEAEAPLFLFVNVVDTHFPYTHSEVDEIVASPDLARSEIREQAADRIWETYANTAANVDVAIRNLVEHWEAKFSGADYAILVIADHGEAFYEKGTLGHGQTIEGIETRVPLITVGLGGEWPEPIAISDVRGLLSKNLFRLDRGERPTFVADPEKRLFQYLGRIEAPSRIAHRGVDRTIVLDIEAGTSWALDAGDQRTTESVPVDQLNELVWHWETIQSEHQAVEDRN